MTDYFSKAVRETRRFMIVQKKRFDLARYNLAVKTQMGVSAEAFHEAVKMVARHKSLNLLDFERNREKDLFLLDVHSDRTRFGGVTQTELSIMQDSDGDTYLNLQAKLRKERSGLVPINYMFSGFQCLNLVQEEFSYYNGFRITMRAPAHPCKFGVHILTGINEYEHYIGHLVDTQASQQSTEWVQYEMPINLMVNNNIQSALIHTSAEDHFRIKGLTFHLEKQNSSYDPAVELDEQGEPHAINLQIKKIDAIYNPEYEEVVQAYRLPIFIKSLSKMSDDLTFFKQGFVDNGRKQIKLWQDHEKVLEQMSAHQKVAVNSIGFEDAPAAQQQQTGQQQTSSSQQKSPPKRSIKDRLKSRASQQL